MAYDTDPIIASFLNRIKQTIDREIAYRLSKAGITGRSVDASHISGALPSLTQTASGIVQLTAKGDLETYGSSPTRLPVGTPDGKRLTVRSSATDGIDWEAMADVLVTKTSAYSVTVDDGVILCDATGASFVLSLPAANSVPAGKEYRFKKIDSTANTVQINVAGADKMDGLASSTLSAQFNTLGIVGDGASNWEIMPVASGSGMANPMTTLYDLILGGVGGTPTRLAKGSASQELAVVSHDLAAPTAPTVTVTATGGTLVAGHYDIEVTYVDVFGESLASFVTTVVTTGTTSQITVNSPAADDIATGYYVYMSQPY